MSLFESPSARSPSTSCSRGVSSTPAAPVGTPRFHQELHHPLVEHARSGEHRRAGPSQALAVGLAEQQAPSPGADQLGDAGLRAQQEDRRGDFEQIRDSCQGRSVDHGEIPDHQVDVPRERRAPRARRVLPPPRPPGCETAPESPAAKERALGDDQDAGRTFGTQTNRLRPVRRSVNSPQPSKATRFWRACPRASAPYSTTSPGCRNAFGVRPKPTPSGVPVLITSPGRRDMKSLT